MIFLKYQNGETNFFIFKCCHIEIEVLLQRVKK